MCCAAQAALPSALSLVPCSALGYASRASGSIPARAMATAMMESALRYSAERTDWTDRWSAPTTMPLRPAGWGAGTRSVPRTYSTEIGLLSALSVLSFPNGDEFNGYHELWMGSGNHGCCCHRMVDGANQKVVSRTRSVAYKSKVKLFCTLILPPNYPKG